MPYRANYPATVAEVLQQDKTYKPAALAAVRALRRAKPWRGTSAQRLRKFRVCIRRLAMAYYVPCPLVTYNRRRPACYRPGRNEINLDKFSVVTLLHEFGHVRGFDERQTCVWSINLFRRLFPRSFARCRFQGHLVLQGV